MKSEIYRIIGQIFAKKWIESQNNPKLNGWNPDPEHVQIGQSELYKISCAGALLVLAGMIIFVMQFLKGEDVRAPLFLIGISTLMTSIHTFFPLGKNEIELIRVWMPLRKKLRKFGIIREVCRILKGEENSIFIESFILPILIQALNNRMRNFFEDLRAAERIGKPAKELRIQKKMNLLRDLIENDLKLQMSWPEEYFDHARI